MLTEGLRLGPGRLNLLDLENRNMILPYQERYEYVRDELQRRRIPLEEPTVSDGEGEPEAETSPRVLP